MTQIHGCHIVRKIRKNQEKQKKMTKVLKSQEIWYKNAGNRAECSQTGTPYIYGCHIVRNVRKNQEKQKKKSKIRKSQEKMGVFEKMSGNVRKFDINMLLIRKFIITKTCILLMFFLKNFAYAIHLFFSGSNWIFGINYNLL